MSLIPRLILFGFCLLGGSYPCCATFTMTATFKEILQSQWSYDLCKDSEVARLVVKQVYVSGYHGVNVGRLRQALSVNSRCLIL